ncbi:hypothetical protein [Williamsia sp. D3]|uniref:hypothetical protein n=1 Tax=Williamsia sp. D3 TaxID=1313067 RepID=UPI0009DD80E1
MPEQIAQLLSALVLTGHIVASLNLVAYGVANVDLVCNSPYRERNTIRIAHEDWVGLYKSPDILFAHASEERTPLSFRHVPKSGDHRVAVHPGAVRQNHVGLAIDHRGEIAL